MADHRAQWVGLTQTLIDVKLLDAGTPPSLLRVQVEDKRREPGTVVPLPALEETP